MKRPAAAVKAEILTPTKPGEGKPHVTPEKAMPVEGKGSPAERSKKRSPKPKASPKPKPSPLKVSWKALAKVKAKAKAAAAKAKPGEGCLPSPGTAAWKDVSYQLQQMEKKGDTRLKKSFNACQSQQAKRKWYYNIFLLDPAISKKEVHKISLEKASFESATSRGWITKWKVGELEGANPQAANFEELCDDAVQGMDSKDHPNPAWKAKGVKLYWYEGTGMEVEKHKSQSMTSAQQHVELDADHFQEVESRLAVEPGEGQQLMLLGKGGGSSSHALPAPKPMPEEGPAEPTEEELEAEAYKKALGSLKKAINALSSSLDKGAVLKETLASLPNAGDAVVKAHIECLEKAAKSYGASKADWLKTLGTYPSKIKPGEGNDLVEKLERKKGECESTLKELNKLWAPLKLWARNEGL